jgi:PAS domain S-box-containing protein
MGGLARTAIDRLDIANESPAGVAAMLDSLPDGAALYDADYRLIACNALYREAISEFTPIVAPDAAWEDVLHAILKSGAVGDGFETAEDLARALLAADETGGVEMACAGGRRLLARARRGADGGVMVTWTDIAALKRDAEEHRESAARLREIYAASPVPLFASNAATGDIVYANPKLEMMLGLREGGATKMNVANFYAEPSIRPSVRAALDKYGWIDDWEIKARRSDGTEIWVSLSTETLDLGGETLYVSAIFDLAERKRSQQIIESSEARFRDFAETASDWFWETDANLCFTGHWGQNLEPGGLDPAAVMGRTRREVADAPDNPNLIAHMEGMAARRPFKDFVYSRTGKDGKARRLKVSGRPVHDPGGKFLGYRGTGTDITREYEAEERATTALTHLMGAMESISEGIALFDEDDRLVVCNEKYRWTDEQTAHLVAPGALWQDIIGGRIDSGFWVHSLGSSDAQMRARWAHHRQLDSALEEQSRDGRWAMVREYPTGDGGFALVLTDITDLKQREASLSEARDAAEQAAQAKSAFLANMSHELRTPLNSIIGFSEVMRNESFGPLGSERYAEYVRGIRDSGMHLLAVINDILDLSKAEAGKLKLRNEPVEISVLLADATRVMVEQVETAGLTLVNECLEPLPPLMGDGRKILQILLNLLSNAVKFTPKGGRITVSAEIEPGGDVVVKVADTGVGMSADDIKVALSAFGQVDHQRNRHHQGTGLGLSLSRQLAQLHGGALEMTSIVDEGTVVTLRLPGDRLIKTA